jgi:hypothetical protein
MKEGSRNGVSLYGRCERGTWWGDSFTEDPEGYITEGSENGHLSTYGSYWGTWRGRRSSFPKGFQRQTKEGSRNEVSTFMGIL